MTVQPAQVGGVQVLSDILSTSAETVPSMQDLESDDDESSNGISEVQQLWLLALQILHRVVACNLVGISCVIQVGPPPPPPPPSIFWGLGFTFTLQGA